MRHAAPVLPEIPPNSGMQQTEASGCDEPRETSRTRLSSRSSRQTRVCPKSGRFRCRDKILVFCDSIYPLTKFGQIFGYPVLDGSTAESQRKRVLAEFRQNTERNVVFLSKIGDTSIDLPEATVLIQVQGQEGSRRQEAQRLGRILRPKMGLCAGTQAFFYTLVSRDTKVVHAEWREV